MRCLPYPSVSVVEPRDAEEGWGEKSGEAEKARELDEPSEPVVVVVARGEQPDQWMWMRFRTRARARAKRMKARGTLSGHSTRQQHEVGARWREKWSKK